MKEQTLLALWKSIEHHHENWRNPETADVRSSTCALCRRFGEMCHLGEEKCPVMMATGSHGCMYTPWESLFMAHYDLPDNEDVFRFFEEAEIGFLVDLLPEVEHEISS